MRKNLFLTLALLVAAFATAGAQTWQQYLTAMDGLPSGTANETTNVEEVKTALITPTSPIEGLRITVLANKSGGKFGDYPFTAFSEIKIIDGDGNLLNYTATGNAVQGNDGQGLPALSDGDPATYLHTSWSGTNPNEHHYVELAFEAPVSSFRLMWGNRQGNPKDAVTIAALTAAGVPADTVKSKIPEIEESAYTLGNQLTSIDALLAAKYVTMFAERMEGEYAPDYKGDNAFKGPCYYSGVGAAAADRVLEGDEENLNGRFAAQFIPTGDGDDTYYLYWPELGAYLARNTINGGNDQNDMQNWYNTENAAKLTIHPISDGAFELSYKTTRKTTADDGTVTEQLENQTGWVMADNRERALKVVGDLSKADLQSANPQYPQGQYRLPGCFSFKFFETTYEQPSYVVKNMLSGVLFDALQDPALFGGKQAFEEESGTTFYETLIAAIQEAQDGVDEGDMQASEATELINEIHTAQAMYVYTVCYQKLMDLLMYYQELQDAGMLIPEGAPLEAGKYTEASFNAILMPFVSRLQDVHIYNYENTYVDTPYENCYAPAVADLLAIPAAKERFEGNILNVTPFPVLYNAENSTLPGENIDSRAVWESPSIRPGFEAIEGFRITFLKSVITGPNAGPTVDKEKYNPIALDEMIVYDADGNKLNITIDMLSTNAQELNEGPLSGLIDGTFDVDGNITNYGTFYHSPWSNNHTWDPKGYIYFDVQLPEGTTGFSIKTIGRNKGCFHPTEVYIGEYGEVYDPVAVSPNEYNASVGAQVTDINQISEDEVYLLQGLIKTNTNTAAVPEASRINPNWYAGRNPFHETVVREDCAYLLVKNSDGTFKILSLSQCAFLNADGELVTTEESAGNFNIVPSTNPDFAGQSTFVIYSDIAEPETLKIGGDITITGEKSITFVDSVEVTLPYKVLMDWGPGYSANGRACIDFQPGLVAANYGASNAEAIAQITAENIAINSAGDYLHFNKTSGEGEWKIYKMNMDEPYYYWTTVLVDNAASPDLAIGDNPGQLKAVGTLTEDIATAQAVVENNNYAGAKAAAWALARSMSSALGGANRNPVVEGTYMLEAAHQGFGRRYAMYVDANTGTLKWGSKPAAFADNDADCVRFIFEFKTPGDIDDLISDEVITEEQRNIVFNIMNVNTGEYISEKNLVADKDQAGAFLVSRGEADIFDIADLSLQPNQHRELHCDGHGGGNGTGGNIVLWNTNADKEGASAWRLIKQAVPTSIEMLVAEGDEVESVTYFTAGGAQVPAPVKGLNLINIVYKNGATETKKVVIE